MAATVLLEGHGVGKRYRRRRPWALRDVDFAIPAGSITALVGPNGSGKSTLIKGCIGFERPTTGRLVVDGVDPWRDRGGAVRHAGYVPQAPSLYRELSVEDHLALAASSRPGFDRAHARLRLRQLDIPLTARADELSGGQQAQVGLALALGTRARVLLLDEPLASLDPLARREFLHILAEGVHADGSTALLSSHVIADIEQACDRLLVLGGGRKLLDVSIAEARATHRVVEGEPTPGSGRLVGRFPGPLGEPLALVEDPGPAGRSPTLEEVVLGHLAAGRAARPTVVGETRSAVAGEAVA
jgi:ABC-2 type transport system ATP-binding protein